MILRLALAALVIYLLVRGIRSVLRAREQARRAGQGSPEGAAAPGAPETLRPCALCGVNLPERDAVHWQGRYFCSLEHASRAGHAPR